MIRCATVAALAALALAACADAASPLDDTAGAAPTTTAAPAADPEAPMRAIFAVLGRLDVAARKQDASFLAPVIADDYVAIACGLAGRFASPLLAARARIAQPATLVGAWRVAISADATMAWAFASTEGAVAIEILERRGTHWMIVGGAASGSAAADDGCTLPPTELVTPAPTTATLALHALSTKTAMVAVCGITTEDVPMVTSTTHTEYETIETRQRHQTLDLDSALAPDDDHDGVPDLLEACEHCARVSPDGTLAWLVGGPRGDGPGYHSLAIAHRGISGWELDALVWSPVDRVRCPPGEKQRVVVRDSSIEILDYVYFRKNVGAMDPVSFPIVDAIAATLKGNPQITRISIDSYATLDETDPIALAERRGVDVRARLNKLGIPLSQLDVHFFANGYQLPTNPDDVAAQRLVRFQIVESR